MTVFDACEIPRERASPEPTGPRPARDRLPVPGDRLQHPGRLVEITRGIDTASAAQAADSARLGNAPPASR
ncbi:hypothetical protein UA75_00475 [Actinoalloteichus sp. GBA129-24]|uniref:Uncharacterized protein n=1 Tax=Actinoalloteichus fjordicus TaxID=1612552 RepID=A0AAC9L9D4_9PSEU|nr:hypothetical protein UA74_00475 [Actinoalloteichus fjordicus]APU18146.1 hypothetical protein UA75_00475 [Actinoalloteichus sp. GBA129-24]